MKVRPLEPHETERYLPLRQALWPDTADAAEVAHQLAYSERFQIFIAEDSSDNLVGLLEVSLRDYAEGCETSPVDYLEGWYVACEHRRSGVGRRLVEAAEEWARAKSSTEIASDTKIHNTLSQQAHVQLGYAEVEQIVCFRKSS